MAKIISLDDIIKDSQPEIYKILETNFREKLDVRTTILDLSREALKVNVYRNTQQHIEAFNSSYDILIKTIRATVNRKYTSLQDAVNKLGPGYFQNKGFNYIFIDNGDDDRFIVGSSYGVIDNFMYKISRNPNVVKTSFGTSTVFKADGKAIDSLDTEDFDKKFRRKSDIGHIPTKNNINLVSPLEEKISAIQRYGSSLNSKEGALITEAATEALNELYEIQVDATYNFNNTTPDKIKVARGILGEGYVVVTLHRKKLNNKFSAKESKILYELKKKIATVLEKQPFELVQGSNNIIQDIEQLLIRSFTASSNDIKNFKKHTPKNKTTPKKSISINTKVLNTSTTVKKKQPKAYISSLNLTSLLNSLNQQITQKVRENMGTGYSKDVLNYRTGRFAQSVKVERLSESKAGMITAFYSYMKNPYATFSQGGRQENPRSRDPKLLISKSIREIAATLVTNRLRAVNL